MPQPVPAGSVIKGAGSAVGGRRVLLPAPPVLLQLPRLPAGCCRDCGCCRAVPRSRHAISGARRRVSARCRKSSANNITPLRDPHRLPGLVRVAPPALSSRVNEGSRTTNALIMECSWCSRGSLLLAVFLLGRMQTGHAAGFRNFADADAASDRNRREPAEPPAGRRDFPRRSAGICTGRHAAAHALAVAPAAAPDADAGNDHRPRHGRRFRRPCPKSGLHRCWLFSMPPVNCRRPAVRSR